MRTKICGTCKQSLPTTQFHKRKRNKDGLKEYCKQCASKKEADRYSRKSEYIKQRVSEYTKRPGVKRRAYDLRNMSGSHREHESFRRQSKMSRLSKVYRKQILEIYLHASDCSIVTGETYQVDHIVPLKHKRVCGLHVPWNLQVLPADINYKKRNYWDEETSY